MIRLIWDARRIKLIIMFILCLIGFSIVLYVTILSHNPWGDIAPLIKLYVISVYALIILFWLPIICNEPYI